MPDDCVLACINPSLGQGRSLPFRWTLPLNRPGGQT